jgi:hypothetical protein
LTSVFVFVAVEVERAPYYNCCPVMTMGSELSVAAPSAELEAAAFAAQAGAAPQASAAASGNNRRSMFSLFSDFA